MSKIKAFVFIYQRNLNAKDFPTKAEVLKEKGQRIYLRWKTTNDAFTEQWVNRGCCSEHMYKQITKPKLELK